MKKLKQLLKKIFIFSKIVEEAVKPVPAPAAKPAPAKRGPKPKAAPKK